MRRTVTLNVIDLYRFYIKIKIQKSMQDLSRQTNLPWIFFLGISRTNIGKHLFSTVHCINQRKENWRPYLTIERMDFQFAKKMSDFVIECGSSFVLFFLQKEGHTDPSINFSLRISMKSLILLTMEEITNNLTITVFFLTFIWVFFCFSWQLADTHELRQKCWDSGFMSCSKERQ